jgi:hypothetical protein
MISTNAAYQAKIPARDEKRGMPLRSYRFHSERHGFTIKENHFSSALVANDVEQILHAWAIVAMNYS